MDKFTSHQDLAKAYEQYKPLLALRQKDAAPKDAAPDAGRLEFLVCGDTGCRSIDKLAVLHKLDKVIKDKGLEDKASASITGCFGFCKKGPIVKVFPNDIFYTEVTEDDAEEIVLAHLEKKTLVDRLLYRNPEAPDTPVPHEADIDFYRKQKRTALANCGLIHPDRIEEYIAAGGYLALSKCLKDMNPQEVVTCISESGLRGRGGGGFPTGIKWQAAAKQPAGKKYVVCNADEGDPGAFMDRSILEGDPHCVLEGMAVAAYAIGSDQGYIYVRAEYPLAIKRLEQAIGQARQAGLLGENILGSGFNFDLELKYGAGAFVCGEETALLHSIEGGRGEPMPKPPFPAERGLYGKPTIINNVETFANVRRIILNGAAWFASMGSEKSKGTKVFALAGKIRNVGLVEVPMGITLREIVYDIGGGIKDGKEFKAVQTGGPSGGCISKENLDIPIDYDSLTSIGSMMGSGGMIVMDEDNCMVDIAKFYLDFTVEESCGKCTPCRIGTKRLYELLTEITEGRGTEAHLEKLKSLGAAIKDTALCGLGQTAPNPVLSTMQYFWDEYVAHVRDKRCPAGVCTALLSFFISEACIGCGLCAKKCPVKCISGERKERHVIDTPRCIKCGTCKDVCPVQAVIRQ